MDEFFEVIKEYILEKLLDLLLENLDSIIEWIKNNPEVAIMIAIVVIRIFRKDKYKEKLRPCVELTTFLPPGKSVICRKKELKKIKKILKKDKHILIWGFEGIGTTTLVKFLYQTIRKKYSTCSWIVYTGNLKMDFLHSISWGEDALKENPDEWWNKFKLYLGKQLQENLLVIDHVGNISPEEQEVFREIAGWNHTTVLVTSPANKDIPGFNTKYHVRWLSKAQCVKIFYQYYTGSKHKERKFVKKLVVLAGQHTFAVELLAKSANREESLSEYYKKLNNDGFSMSNLRFTTDHHAGEATIAEHLKKLFDLQTCIAREQSILCAFAVISVEQGLKKDEIENWFGYTVNDMEPLVQNGWLDYNDGWYSMRQIVKKIILLHGFPYTTAEYYLQYINNDENGYFSQNKTDVENHRKLTIAENILKTVPEEEKSLLYTDICIKIGKIYQRSIKNYKKALEYYKEAKISYELTQDLRSDYEAIIYHCIGSVYSDLENQQNALQYLNDALKKYERIDNRNYKNIAMAHNEIAKIYYSKRRYHLARNEYKDALKSFLCQNHTSIEDIKSTYQNIQQCGKRLGYKPKDLSPYLKSELNSEEYTELINLLSSPC